MVTIYKIDKSGAKANINEANVNYIFAELRGLSRDEKPSVIDGKEIGNGSAFIEIDTGKVYLYDAENKQWKEI